MLAPSISFFLTFFIAKGYALFSIQKGDEDFPGGTVVKNLPANAGDTGLSPGLGRSPMPQSN